MNNGLKLKIVLSLYLLVIFSLFLYSFTQIDLSLTFSRINFLRDLVKSFQYVGFFNRPLSTYIYLSLLILLFVFYIYFLKKAQTGKVGKKTVWRLLIGISVVLVFSYNAFSYDLFNYIFDAKIVTQYHANPYLHKALDFPEDPMLSFMRWTHRVYPYGPVWLILTVPLSFIGMNLFLPTVFLFKSVAAVSLLGSLYFIGKIFQKIAPAKEIAGLIVFGLNPLVLVESLVSAHLDIVMIFFALFATHKFIEKKYFFAFMLLFISIGVKFSTIFLMPLFIIFFFLRNKKITDSRAFFQLGTALLAVSVYFSSSYSGNFQPWYLLLPLAFSVFIYDRYFIKIPALIFSVAALLTYAPYLYFGNGEDLVTLLMYQILLGSIILSVFCVVIYYFKVKLFASEGTI